MDEITRPTEGVRCYDLKVTSLGSQTHIPITAFAVVGSKSKRVKAYLHAAICRADLSAPRNREANRRV